MDGSDPDMGRCLRVAISLALVCFVALITAQPSVARSTVTNPLSTAAMLKWRPGYIGGVAGASASAASSVSKLSAAQKRRRLKRLCSAKRTRVCRKLRESARQLTVNLGGQGAGSVAGPGIRCPGDCLESYRSGTRVSLVATPSAGSNFMGWSGACSGTGACRVTMKSARLVAANFNPSPTSPPPPQTTYALNVTVSGGGSVAGSGISCPGDCSESYTGGTHVALAASPGAGNELTTWDGACSGSSANCTVTMDAARSVGADFASDPSPPPPPPPPPPVGITTTPVDGGPDYYSHFSNPLPSDTAYFPITAWFRPALDQSTINREKAFGLNGMVGVENPEGTQEGLLRQAGMHVFVQADERTRFNDIGSETAGWLTSDELDMCCGPPGFGGGNGYQMLDSIRAGLPQDNRLRFTNYGKGVIFWETDQQAAQFVNQYQDVVSDDVYWFTDPNEKSDPRSGFAYGYGDTVSRIRYLDSLDGKRKPVWAVVELGWPFTESASAGGRRILPAESRAAVWQSLIAGARGIVYFDHNFGPGTPGSTILDAGYPDTQAMMKSVNAQVQSLAPVLNSPTITSGVSVSGPVRWMGKLTSSGGVYIFAGATTGATSATFTVPSGTTAEVVGEGRNIPISGGTFTDSFADKNAIHIYRVSG
jgi:List-Bact-rpt repeat protein